MQFPAGEAGTERSSISNRGLVQSASTMGFLHQADYAIRSS